ncbi:MAG: amidohydrolase [Acidobacteriota bacterium]
MSMRSKCAVFAWAVLLAVTPCFAEQAELVLINGRIATVDKANRIAQAVAIKGDRILAVGSGEEIRAYIAAGTKVVDLRGAFAMPGFIESHGHLLSLGRSKMQLDLTRARSWDDIVAMVAEAAREARPGQWIGGRGWHQDKWDNVPEPNVQGLPLHDKLSSAAPRNPVILVHASGHSCLANAKAMELAGVNKDTKSPGGGEIVKDASGIPIGAFLENAQDLIYDALNKHEMMMPAAERAALEEKALDLAQADCLAKGVTSFGDAGVSFGTVDMYKRRAEAHTLGVRIYAMVSENNDSLEKRLSQYKCVGLGDNFLTVRAVKRLIDGALGARGAWLLAPYADLTSSTGMCTEPLPELRRTAEICIREGFQLCTHAIGDRGNREALDIYQETFAVHPERRDLRWRIEHAQHIDPADIPRFGKLGVIAAMQGIHCTSDAPWVIKRLGTERAEADAYAWRKLIDNGAVICNGTDVPVEDGNPIPSFYASVTRRLKDGTTFFAAQRMTREEALRSYTINGAFAAFEDTIKGSIEPGKLADIVVLSGDLLALPDDDVPKVRVLMTIVGGRVVIDAR